MKLARLLVYLALGFVARSLFLFFFGDGGLVDYYRLEAYRRQLEQNLQSLEEINGQLMEEQRALGTDPDRVALQARELGYYREGERVIRLEGQTTPKRYFNAGKLIRARGERERQGWLAGGRLAGDHVAKLLGLVVPLALFVVAVVRDWRRRRAPQRR